MPRAPWCREKIPNSTLIHHVLYARVLNVMILFIGNENRSKLLVYWHQIYYYYYHTSKHCFGRIPEGAKSLNSALPEHEEQTKGHSRRHLDRSAGDDRYIEDILLLVVPSFGVLSVCCAGCKPHRLQRTGEKKQKRACQTAAKQTSFYFSEFFPREKKCGTISKHIKGTEEREESNDRRSDYFLSYIVDSLRAKQVLVIK